MRTVRPILAVAALAASLLLPACADGAGDSGGRAPETSPPSTTTPAPSPAVPSPATPSPAVPSPEPPRLVTPRPPVAAEADLTGEVISGVMPGCTLLQTDHGDYLLLGEAARELRVGSTVTVRGEVRTDVATTCQQGTPFEVTEVLP